MVCSLVNVVEEEEDDNDDGELFGQRFVLVSCGGTSRSCGGVRCGDTEWHDALLVTVVV